MVRICSILAHAKPMPKMLINLFLNILVAFTLSKRGVKSGVSLGSTGGSKRNGNLIL